MKNIQLNIAQRLKDLRSQFDYSQQNVADGIGMKLGSYQAYEEKRATPDIYNLINLSKFYGFYSIDQLLGITEMKDIIVNEMLHAYAKAGPEKQKIVDFILYN